MLTSHSFLHRLPVVNDRSNDCPGQTARVTSNLHSSSSTMAVSRVPSPPLPEVNTPVAENWCYTQVSPRSFSSLSRDLIALRLCGSMKLHSLARARAMYKEIRFADFFSPSWSWRMNGMSRLGRVDWLNSFFSRRKVISRAILDLCLKLAQRLSLPKSTRMWH